MASLHRVPCDDILSQVAASSPTSMSASVPPPAPPVVPDEPPVKSPAPPPAAAVVPTPQPILRENWWIESDDLSSTDASQWLIGEHAVLQLDDCHLRCTNSTSIRGRLTTTSYRMYFTSTSLVNLQLGGISQTKLQKCTCVSLASIAKIETTSDRGFEIRTKHGTQFRYVVPASMNSERITTCINGYAFPVHVDHVFAYYHMSTSPDPSLSSWWSKLGMAPDLHRLQITSHQLYRLTEANEKYRLCPTYPAVLAVPRDVSDAQLHQVASYRSKGRIPILTWFNESVSLWRCAQPLGGIQHTRNSHDESMLSSILKTNSMQHRLTILDARPRLNAMGNRLAGAGYERVDGGYAHCTLTFLNIQNIHAVRESAAKLAKVCHYAPTDTGVDVSHFWNKVEGSGWLSHISDILKGTRRCVVELVSQRSVLTHCSDGWDRTAQLCALTQLCLDPYYRTRIGLASLIQKDWLDAGHKFAERCGHTTAVETVYSSAITHHHSKASTGETEDVHQRSPVFIQFLDCVYQLTLQYPKAFEFSSKFLKEIAGHVYSCRFGTFLFNSSLQRTERRVKERTLSLWAHFFERDQPTADHLNVLYERNEQALIPSGSGKFVALWKDYWITELDLCAEFAMEVDFTKGTTTTPCSSIEAVYEEVLRSREAERQHEQALWETMQKQIVEEEEECETSRNEEETEQEEQ